MTAYVTVDLNVKDADVLKKYSDNSPSTIEKFGGKFVAKGPVTVLHGTSEFATRVIVSFPDKEKAVAWYESPEYQALIETRDEGMDSKFTLV